MLFLLAGGVAAQSADLIISEYVEGSHLRDEALEFFNPTSQAVQIGEYHLEIYYRNSGGLFMVGFPRGEIEPGETFVVVDVDAHPDLGSLADHSAARLPFIGVDTIMLVNGQGMIVDTIGQRVIDASSGWFCSEGSTIDHTLRRLPNICTGDTNPDDVFDPCLEWEFFPVDTFDGLGSHVTDCSPVPVQSDTWGSIKSSYR